MLNPITTRHKAIKKKPVPIARCPFSTPPASPSKRKKAAPAVMLLFTLHLLSALFRLLISEPVHKDPFLETHNSPVVLPSLISAEPIFVHPFSIKRLFLLPLTLPFNPRRGICGCAAFFLFFIIRSIILLFL